MGRSPDDTSPAQPPFVGINRQWPKIKHHSAQPMIDTKNESGSAHAPQRKDRQPLKTTQPKLSVRSDAKGSVGKPVTGNQAGHSFHVSLERIEASLRQVLHEIIWARQEPVLDPGLKEVPLARSALRRPAKGLDNSSAIPQPSQVELNTVSTTGQSLPSRHRGFKTIMAPGPLMFIAFDKDEFNKSFSDEWYDKRWKQHTVRWNGKGREWKSMDRSLASGNTELDSDDDRSSLEEEAWSRMVGNRYLEGMRVGTVLRRPRYATSRP